MYVFQKMWSTSDIADYLCYGFVAKIPQWKGKNNVWQHRNNQGPLRVTISHFDYKVTSPFFFCFSSILMKDANLKVLTCLSIFLAKLVIAKR